MITQNPTDHPYYKTLEPIIDVIAGWINNYRRAAHASEELKQCGPEEVKRIAHDLNITPQDLAGLASKGPGTEPLLYKMLAALGVDREKNKYLKDPLLMRDLERICFSCEHKARCVHELQDSTAKENYRDFCPNSYTLDTLIGRKH